MGINFNSYKCAGVIYQIDEIEYTKKSNWPKRYFYLEVPTASGDNQKSEIFRFLVMGDEAASLNYYNEGDWVEVMFKIEGRFWTPPDEKDKSVYLGSLRPIDIHKGENPYERNKKDYKQNPDEASPDHLAELAKNVYDLANQPREPSLFDPPTGDDDDLPF
jgi:hypothetical protein